MHLRFHFRTFVCDFAGIVTVSLKIWTKTTSRESGRYCQLLSVSKRLSLRPEVHSTKLFVRITDFDPTSTSPIVRITDSKGIKVSQLHEESKAGKVHVANEKRKEGSLFYSVIGRRWALMSKRSFKVLLRQ